MACVVFELVCGETVLDTDEALLGEVMGDEDLEVFHLVDHKDWTAEVAVQAEYQRFLLSNPLSLSELLDSEELGRLEALHLATVGRQGHQDCSGTLVGERLEA